MPILRNIETLVIMVLCLAPAALAGASTDQWQKVSYQKATANKMRPLDLALSLPPEFIIRYRTQLYA